MNLHVIQSEEARAEAKILMRVQEHIPHPRYGGAVIGGIHDHISGAYLLSRPGTLISVEHGLEMLGKHRLDRFTSRSCQRRERA